jgi:Tfp pilus assembly PilM family ATPase
MNNVTKINTSLMLQSEFALLKSDCQAFTKKLAVQTDLLQKYLAWQYSLQALEKMQLENVARLAQQAKVAALKLDLEKFERRASRTKRHPTGHGAY